MFIKKRKGLAMGQLVIIMLVLVAFFLIAGTIMRFQSKTEGKEAELICHDSLILKAHTKVNLGVKDVSTPALCKTIDREFSAKSKEDAMEYVAKSMERCWWIWLEGRYPEMFGAKGFFGIGGDEKTKCFVCSTLHYEEGPSFNKLDLISELGKLNSKHYGGGSILSYVQENGYVEVIDETYYSENIYGVVFASNIEESVWLDSFGRSLGFYPPYNQNGLWLVSMNKFEETQPCYYQPGISGN